MFNIEITCTKYFIFSLTAIFSFHRNFQVFIRIYSEIFKSMAEILSTEIKSTEIFGTEFCGT